MATHSPYHDPFDPHAPERQLRAARKPWRPILLAAGLALVVGGAIAFDRTIVEAWWPFGKDERPRAGKNLIAKFDVDGDWEPAPPLMPAPVVLQSVREIPVQMAQAAPTPPPVPEPVAQVPIQKVGFAGMVTHTPQNRPALAMVDGRVPAQAQGCTLVPGLSEIHATFKDEVRWDMGGQIEAMVKWPVVSPERPQNVLIPEGAMLVGYADPENLKRGMDLAPAPVWAYVSWVDSDTGERRTRNLHGAPGANVSGVNGIGGEVDARWGPIIGLMALETVFDVIGNIQINLGDSGDTVNTTITGNSVDSIGTMVARQLLDVKPRITTKAGTNIIVKPKVPIQFC